MRNLLLATAIALIVAFGVGEALWTGRWSSSREPVEAAAKLTSVPLSLGNWVGKDLELDPRQVVQGEMTGHLLRFYIERTSGKNLQVLLICGRAGPTSLHTPDICFQGAGYNQDAAKVKRTVKGPSEETPADFWVARFQKPGPTPDPLQIYWSWSATGSWNAPDYPRMTFGGYPFLYKLYVVHPLSKLDEPSADDPTPEFLRLLLPELHKSLFS